MRYLEHAFFICIFFLFGSLSAVNSFERRTAFNALVERDLQLLPPDIRAWLDKQTIPVKQFNKEVAKLNYQKLLSTLHEASKYVKKPATYGLRPEHVGKNVHIGCVPFDETRSLRHLEGFYISASDVLTPEQTYIVGEAPIEPTEDIFWQAIVEADVRTIAALVTPTDGAYWDSSRFPKTVRRWKIEMISEEDEGYSPLLVEQRIIRRVFKISYHDDCRIITHLHYKNWPDHGAPDPALFHRFLALLDDAHPGSSYPIFVHCAAGIGRSGTFVAAHSLRKEVLMHRASDGPLSINIAKRILEMRMQRYKLLSRPTQLRAVIEAVRDAIQQRAQ